MIAPVPGPVGAAPPPGLAYCAQPAAEYNQPVIDRNAWLADHPGGVIGQVPGQLVMRAQVAGVIIATCYGSDLRALMALVHAAESEGRCPLHRTTDPEQATEQGAA